MIIRPSEYNLVLDHKIQFPSVIKLCDHLNGFDLDLNNQILDILSNNNRVNRIIWHGVVDDSLSSVYPKLEFSTALLEKTSLLTSILPAKNLRDNINNTFKNLVCSFSGGGHRSRTLLLSALKNFNYFNLETCSKNHTFSNKNVHDIVSSESDSININYFGVDNEFQNLINDFKYTRFDHVNNFLELYPRIKSSFVHIVSETMATMYYPFVTEKFLYSILSQGLFLTYGQPGWHKHIRDFYGFKLYDTVFDYSFDDEINPVDRLIKLLSMISKFQHLKEENLNLLYEAEVDNINYNFEHYTSGDYKNHLERYTSD